MVSTSFLASDEAIYYDFDINSSYTQVPYLMINKYIIINFSLNILTSGLSSTKLADQLTH